MPRTNEHSPGAEAGRRRKLAIKTQAGYGYEAVSLERLKRAVRAMESLIEEMRAS